MDNLQQRRDKARRPWNRPGVPPSRHGPLPAPDPETAAAATVEEPEPSPDPKVTAIVAPASAPRPRSSSALAVVRQATRKPPPTKTVDRVVIYLEPEQARWLERLQAQAQMRGERVTISSIVRVALQEFRQHHG